MIPRTILNTLRLISRTARPIVASARLPEPNVLTPEFIPIASTIRPLTITSGDEPPVLAVEA